MYDEMGPVDEDSRWKPLGDFHECEREGDHGAKCLDLEKSFPLVHQHLERTIVDWALVYEWKGSDESLKPVFLTAHQDVVPVLESTLGQWEQPPFSGYYDGTKLVDDLSLADTAEFGDEGQATPRVV
jgi:Gly-Xaa carboxypeptidase